MLILCKMGKKKNKKNQSTVMSSAGPQLCLKLTVDGVSTIRLKFIITFLL